MKLGSVLAGLVCVAVAYGWADPPKAVTPNSVCADCHDQQAKLAKSAHAAVQCASCHLKHDEYPHPEKQPKPACVTCHESSARDYAQSEHAQQMKRGNGAAPACDTCHGGVHELVRALSPEFHKSVPETCGMCHDKEAAQFATSVHGKAVAAGVPGAPVCTDCHGGHRVLRAKDPRSTVSAGAVPDTCGRCHGDVRLMKRFGLPADRITSFNASFHGLALKSGNQSVAGCASCHGFHDILASSDPRSRTNVKNLAKTCGSCHPGAGTRFTLGTIHEREGQGAPAPVRWAIWFYQLIIPGTLGFMLLHHAGDFIRKLIGMRFRGVMYPTHLLRPVQPSHPHMWVSERVLHVLLAASFIALAYTGFALHYPDGWWAKPTLAFESQFPVRGTVHRIAGVVLVLTAMAHLVSLIVSRTLRRHWYELLPRVSDIREMVEGTLWRLGLLRDKPRQSPHCYIEKIEYWALVWGTAVMAATGALLWANNWTLTFMPKEWMDFARTVHFYEAVLAAFSILIWHFYSVIFDPEVYPMDPSWITGRSPRPENDETH